MSKEVKNKSDASTCTNSALQANQKATNSSTASQSQTNQSDQMSATNNGSAMNKNQNEANSLEQDPSIALWHESEDLDAFKLRVKESVLLINSKLAKSINKLQFIKTKIALLQPIKPVNDQQQQSQDNATTSEKGGKATNSGEHQDNQNNQHNQKSNHVQFVDDADTRAEYVLEMAKASRQHSSAALIQMLNMENRKISESLKLSINLLIDKRRKYHQSLSSNENSKTGKNPTIPEQLKNPAIQKTEGGTKSQIEKDNQPKSKSQADDILSHQQAVALVEDELSVYRQFFADIENLYVIQKAQLDDCFTQLTTKLHYQQTIIIMQLQQSKKQKMCQEIKQVLAQTSSEAKAQQAKQAAESANLKNQTPVPKKGKKLDKDSKAGKNTKNSNSAAKATDKTNSNGTQIEQELEQKESLTEEVNRQQAERETQKQVAYRFKDKLIAEQKQKAFDITLMLPQSTFDQDQVNGSKNEKLFLTGSTCSRGVFLSTISKAKQLTKSMSKYEMTKTQLIESFYQSPHFIVLLDKPNLQQNPLEPDALLHNQYNLVCICYQRTLRLLKIHRNIAVPQSAQTNTPNSSSNVKNFKPPQASPQESKSFLVQLATSNLRPQDLQRLMPEKLTDLGQDIPILVRNVEWIASSSRLSKDTSQDSMESIPKRKKNLVIQCAQYVAKTYKSSTQPSMNVNNMVLIAELTQDRLIH